MDPQVISDELEIRRVLAEYCQLCDDGDFAALATRFTVDGTFEFDGSTASGAEELVRWFEETYPAHRRGKHLTVNSVIGLDGDRAEVVSDFVLLASGRGALAPVMVGRYADEFRRVDGHWRIRQRVVHGMSSPSSEP